MNVENLVSQAVSQASTLLPGRFINLPMVAAVRQAAVQIHANIV